MTIEAVCGMWVITTIILVGGIIATYVANYDRIVRLKGDNDTLRHNLMAIAKLTGIEYGRHEVPGPHSCYGWHKVGGTQ